MTRVLCTHRYAARAPAYPGARRGLGRSFAAAGVSDRHAGISQACVAVGGVILRDQNACAAGPGATHRSRGVGRDVHRLAKGEGACFRRRVRISISKGKVEHGVVSSLRLRSLNLSSAPLCETVRPAACGSAARLWVTGGGSACVFAKSIEKLGTCIVGKRCGFLG